MLRGSEAQISHAGRRCAGAGLHLLLSGWAGPTKSRGKDKKPTRTPPLAEEGRGIDRERTPFQTGSYLCFNVI